MIKKLITFTIIISFGVLNSQSLEFYKDLIHLHKDSVISNLIDVGYNIEKTIPNKDCYGYKLKKNKTTLLYNVCHNNNGDTRNLNIIYNHLKSPHTLLNEAFSDSTMSSKISTIEANTSFIFENEYLEMFFVFDHFHNIHYIEISNSNRYESIKQLFESRSQFNSETNGISLIRKVLDETNSKGESLESILRESEIRSDFSILDFQEASNYLVNLRKSQKYTHLKKLIDNKLLSDKLYLEKIKPLFIRFFKWVNEEHYSNEKFGEALLKIFLENKKFKSIVMFQYIFNSINNEAKN